MKNVIQVLAAFLFITSFYSCKEITAEDFLLTQNNSDILNIKYEYWNSKQLFKKGDNFLQLKDFHENSNQNLWVLQPYPKSEQLSIQIRILKLKGPRILFQLTSRENNKREISFLYGEHPNDSTFYLYPYSTEGFNKAKKNRNLIKLGDNVILQKDKIFFDSVAIANHAKTILTFLKKDMNHSYNFNEEPLVLRGYHYPKLNERTN